MVNIESALDFVKQRIEEDGRDVESVDISENGDGWSIYLNYREEKREPLFRIEYPNDILPC